MIRRSKEDDQGLQPEKFDGYQILRKNELVFKLIDLENVSTSRVGLSPYDGIVSPAYIVLKQRNRFSTKYAEYFFLSMWQREVFNHLGDDGVRSSLNASDLLNVPMTIPSEEEQSRMEYTESNINHRKDGSAISESQTKQEFHDNFNILVVAEKYQTGFDEPLLHTMIVDKKLRGVKAVQTLSRLNRVYPGKEDTFILDFVNTKEDIYEAFQPFYQEIFLENEVNVDKLYTLQNEIKEFKIYDQTDVDAFSKEYFKPGKQDDRAMGRMTSILKPACDKYNTKDQNDRYLFRRKIRSLVRWYGYISQVLRMFDKDLHKECAFCSYLLKLLPKDPKEEVDLEGKLRLEYYKLFKTFEGDIELEDIKGIYVDAEEKNANGTDPKTPLDEIIEKINERYKGEFTEGDKVLITALQNKLMNDPKLLQSAKNSDYKIFSESVFPKAFNAAAMTSYTESRDTYKTLFENKEKYDSIMAVLADMLFKEASKTKIVKL